MKNWVSLLPDYSDLILLNEPWSCFGLFTSLFIHQADESFDRDLKHYKGCKCFQHLTNFPPPRPSPEDAWCSRSRRTQSTSGPASQSKYLRNLQNKFKRILLIFPKYLPNTWASKTLPVLIGLEWLQRTKPGDTSLSSTPFIWNI